MAPVLPIPSITRAHARYLPRDYIIDSDRVLLLPSDEQVPLTRRVEFQKDETVLAIFPQTTVFYPAVVVSGPKKVSVVPTASLDVRLIGWSSSPPRTKGTTCSSSPTTRRNNAKCPPTTSSRCRLGTITSRRS